MDYKKCNMFINHKGMSVRVTSIRRWGVKSTYYDLYNDGGYIGYVKCNGLKYILTNTDFGEVTKFYDTI